jgi:hypothetical protein
MSYNGKPNSLCLFDFRHRRASALSCPWFSGLMTIVSSVHVLSWHGEGLHDFGRFLTVVKGVIDSAGRAEPVIEPILVSA